MLSGIKADRQTVERVQCARVAVKDSLSSKERLEGFISKSKDSHRLMNFLEVKLKWKLMMSFNKFKYFSIDHFMKNLFEVKEN